MRVKVCSNIAQSMIIKLLDGLDIEAYINDLDIWAKGSYDEHLGIIDKVLKQLTANGIKYNPLMGNQRNRLPWLLHDTYRCHPNAQQG